MPTDTTPRPRLKRYHFDYRGDRIELMQGEYCLSSDVAALESRFQLLETERDALEAEVAAMEVRKDAAYEERNRVVAALAKVLPSGITKTAIEGWSEDWHGCVYIDTPVGQCSWHYHNSQAHLFDGLPPYTKPWDGHTTEQKYARLGSLAIESALAAKQSELEALRAHSREQDSLLSAALERVGELEGLSLLLLEAVQKDYTKFNTYPAKRFEGRAQELWRLIQKADKALAKKGAADDLRNR